MAASEAMLMFGSRKLHEEMYCSPLCLTVSYWDHVIKDLGFLSKDDMVGA